MGQHLPVGAAQSTQLSRGAGWRKLLPWHEPKRQAVTYGWWGWFPNIPRNWFGKVLWLLFVGGASVAFGVLATVMMVGMVSQNQEDASFWGGILIFVLLLLGCLLFAWHLLNGIAQARLEHARHRELREELAQTRLRVEHARRRILG